MAKLNQMELHNQVHEAVPGPNEEIVTVTSDKGDSMEYKLNHALKQVWMKTGELEEAAWRNTNGSYEAVMERLGRKRKSHTSTSHPITAVETVPVNFSE